MEDKLKLKVFRNEIRTTLGRDNLNLYETARLIEEYTKLCLKQGMTKRDVQKELKMPDTRYYMIIALLRLDSQTAEMLASNLKGGYGQLARLVYYCKDQSEVDAMVKLAADNKLTTNQAERLLFEKHNPQVVITHLISDINKFEKELLQFEKKIKKYDDVDYERAVKRLQKLKQKLESMIQIMLKKPALFVEK